MTALVLALSLAHAEEPCHVTHGDVTGTMSVAWVSPAGENVGSNSWLYVVPTRDLAQWAVKSEPTVGEFLYQLGLRRRPNPTDKRYKVTIFEVSAEELCRPIDGADPAQIVNGVYPCTNGRGRPTRENSGCGTTPTRKNGEPSFDLYRVQWRDAAARGFCVLPAQRFVEEAGRGPATRNPGD